MNPWIAAGGLVVALLGGGGIFGFFGSRMTNRTTRESAFIDDQAQKIQDLQDEMNALRRRMTDLENRDMLHGDYEQVLRQHISDRKPPPPPPYPPALTGGGQS